MYRLRPTDVLDLRYQYTPQFNESAKIAPDGHVSLMRIGDVKLSGLTLVEAQALLESEAAKTLRDPKITLELTNFEKPYFVVAGQVATPGHYDLTSSHTSVVEAISQAGGFKNSARTTKVIIYRRVYDGLTWEATVDVKHLMEHKASEISVPIHAGDVIVVPQNKFSSVERVVKLLNLGVYYPLPQ